MEENQNKNNIFKYLLVVFLAIFVGTGIFLIINNKKNQTSSAGSNKVVDTTVKQDTLTIPSEDKEKQNQYNLNIKTESVEVKPGTIINVDLYANSNLKNVVGYDAVLHYDPIAFDYLKIEPILPDFRVYNYRKDSYLTLTAVKNLQSNPSPFDNVKIASLLFEAKKTGSFDFSLEPSFGKVKTDFITENTEVLIPGLNKIAVEVK